jgi:hydrogenase maturation protease
MRGDVPPAECKLLVIGYGNTLRSDDGAGVRVAQAVSAWGRPDVRSLVVHQLTPELAELLAGAERVLFVDARSDEEGTDIAILPIEPSSTTQSIHGHISDPRWLLALARGLYGQSPQAWLITVPGVDFSMGGELSVTARTGVERALIRIAQMLE